MWLQANYTSRSLCGFGEVSLSVKTWKWDMTAPCCVSYCTIDLVWAHPSHPINVALLSSLLLKQPLLFFFFHFGSVEFTVSYMKIFLYWSFWHPKVFFFLFWLPVYLSLFHSNAPLSPPLLSFYTCSTDACVGLWKCDGHYPEDVLTLVPVPHQNQRPQGLHTCPPPAAEPQAANVGVFSDDLVGQQRHRL